MVGRWQVWGGIAALLLAAVIVLFVHRRSTHTVPSSLCPPDTARVEAVWLVRGADTLTLRRGKEGWQNQRNHRVSGAMVARLLSFASAVHPEFPLDSLLPPPAGQDSVAQPLGLYFQLRGGRRYGYRLSPWDSVQIRVVEPLRNQCYTARLQGYTPGIVEDLSVRPVSWEENRLGVERPSDLQEVSVEWRGRDSLGFTLRIDTGPCASLLPYPGESGEQRLDTARVSAFLYSLTVLGLSVATDTISDAGRLYACAAVPFYTIRLLLRNGNELRYSCIAIPGERRYAYLLTPPENVGIIRLADWDAAMLQRVNLLKD